MVRISCRDCLVNSADNVLGTGMLCVIKVVVSVIYSAFVARV